MARIIETVTHYQDKEACKSAEEMEQLCCEPTGALQCCKEVVPEWDGYSEEEILDHLGIVLDAQGRDALGRYVNVEFAARIKPCGEQVTTYDLSGENCCDEVEGIVKNVEDSAEIIADNSSGILFWTHGKAPFNVSVRGQGFYLDYARTIRDGVTNANSVDIYTKNACGIAEVTISDGCSLAQFTIRSTTGTFSAVGQTFGFEDFHIDPPGLGVLTTLNSGKWNGDSTRWDGRYYLHTDPVPLGDVGYPFVYFGGSVAALYTVLAPDCFGGRSYPDPIIGKFQVICFADCYAIESLNLTWALAARLQIYEWIC